MKRFVFLLMVCLPMLALPVRAEPIKWVDFDVSYESMKYALKQPSGKLDFISGGLLGFFS